MDQERFKDDLVAAPWQVMGTFDSDDDKYGYWSELLLEILEKHAPIKKKTSESEGCTLNDQSRLESGLTQ